MKKILQLSPSDYWAYCTKRATVDVVTTDAGVKLTGFIVMDNGFEIHQEPDTPTVGLTAVLEALK